MTKRITVSDLNVAFEKKSSSVQVVHDLSFSIDAGETLAVVGESGSGKSVTSLALMRLLPSHAKVSGNAVLHGKTDIDLLKISERQMRAIRGNRIAMIFQEPLSCLNPVSKVGNQIVEAVRCHRNVSKKEALRIAGDLLERVGIPEPGKRLHSFPHELSGGMRQRVMIAIALALEPLLLIADEPTTALDVTIQAQILELLRELQEKNGMSMLFITHNFGVVAEIADRTTVMYSGRVVEQGSVGEVLERPLMPYTQGLMASVPRLETAGLTRDAALNTIEGFIPDPSQMPIGCPFHPRCPHKVVETCMEHVPEMENANVGHSLRCFRWREIEVPV